MRGTVRRGRGSQTRERERESCGRVVSSLREAERRGKAAANTGPSTSNEGRVNSVAEETDEPARGSGSLHLSKSFCSTVFVHVLV
ncbi:General transcription and DNA repair factor [Trichinella pseudospiralis]